MAKVTIDINLPAGVTKEELEHFLNYKLLGHGGTDEVLSKFKYEELDVNYFDIEIND
ncbi:hypothetical protein MHM93_14595 [Pseudoalteromonas sp. MM17-2]|uniref:hypothetical protein n=1 Tax=Pseudoalteromonas sp. MM17-2 TaxID=2917753 RepID=UPI001EF45EDE|nr:hypothetical protein [Pseudoalteromonas sp. MM17-2]MCG7545407.1 hypothetical protein [Pseudoalteromonas sp. MM17-2]